VCTCRCLYVCVSLFASAYHPIQRNSCINKALMAAGITATDPTVAVTDSFLCTGGVTPHIDHIACPGMCSLPHS